MLTKEDLRAIDVRIHQEVFGIPVVALDWPCGHEPECGTYGADYRREPGPHGRCSWYTDLGPVFPAHEDAWPPNEKGEADVDPVPFYSTDIRDAWKVVKKVWDSTVVIMQSDTGRWTATGSGTGPVQDGEHDPAAWMVMPDDGAWYETPELAICMGALEESATPAEIKAWDEEEEEPE